MSPAAATARRVWLAAFAALAAAALTAAAGVAPAFAAAPGLAILAPGQGSLAGGKRIRVRVRGAGPGFHALLGSRDVTARFGPARHGVRTAVLRRGRDFDVGANRLVVGVGRGVGERNLARRFVAGRRHRGLLHLRRVAGSRAALRVHIRGPGRDPFEAVRVELNGRRVSTADWVVGDRTPSSRWPAGRRGFDAMFGADNGLRFGANRLTITAWRKDGAFDRVTRRIRIARSAPLVGAGEGRRTVTGTSVRLNGAATRPRPGTRGVRQRWRIVAAPHGSRAKLRGARTARPVIVPDRPGRYRLQLTTTAIGSGRAAAAARASAAPTRQPPPHPPTPEPPTPEPPLPPPPLPPEPPSPPTPEPPPNPPVPAAPPAAAVDQVVVEATPPTPPIGLPVDTIAAGGGIEVDGKTYAMPAGKDWAQLLVFDRSTLELTANEGFDFSDEEVAKLWVALAGLDADDLVILSGGGRGVAASAVSACLVNKECYEAIVGGFGAAGAAPQIVNAVGDGQLKASLTHGDWSVIGVPGASGSAYANLLGLVAGAAPGGDAGAAGALTGYLQLEAHNHYTFVSPQATTIDTAAPGAAAGANRIRVGSHTYESGKLPSGSGGFHVLVLDSGLAMVHNYTFTTSSGCCSVQPDLDDMIDALGGVSAGDLVVVQSIGDPFGTEARWVEDGKLFADSFGKNNNTLIPYEESTWASPDGTTLAYAVGRLGGGQAHDQIAQMVGSQPQPTPASRQGFTLVASGGMLFYGNSPTESLVPVEPGSTPVSRSQALSHATQSRVIGSLSRDRQSLWSVDLGTTVPGLGLEKGTIAELAYQPPTEWPLAKTAGQKAAGAYIAAKLGFKVPDGDVRAAYYLDSGANWTAKKQELEAISYPGIAHGFTESTFLALKRQLAIEMPMVANVRKMIADWQEVWTSSTIGKSLDLQSIAGEILAQIRRLQKVDSSTSHTLSIVGDSLWIAASTVSQVPILGSGVGVAASSMDLASGLAESSSGAPSTLPVETEAAKLGEEVAGRYESIESSLSQLGEILVSDWGKLQRANSLAAGAWAFNTKVRDAMLEALTISAKREFYAALLAAAYRVYVVDPPWIMGEASIKTPNQISCESDDADHGPTHPFDSYSNVPASWITRPVGFQSDHGSATKLQYLGIYTEASTHEGGVMKHNPHALPQEISAPLFEPIGSGAKALGADKVAFLADSRFGHYWFWCRRWEA